MQFLPLTSQCRFYSSRDEYHYVSSCFNLYHFLWVSIHPDLLHTLSSCKNAPGLIRDRECFWILLFLYYCTIFIEMYKINSQSRFGWNLSSISILWQCDRHSWKYKTIPSIKEVWHPFDGWSGDCLKIRCYFYLRFCLP